MTLLTLYLCWLSQATNAQEENSNTPEFHSKVEIIARPLNDSILLRWAPNNSILWEDANKTGYILERLTLMRDGKLLSSPEHKVLSLSLLMPQPLINWEKAVKSNKYAAIAAQALYGQTFDVKNKTATDFYSVITKVKERDTRFSFALFSADQSPEVAKLSGLWYTDTDVKTNEKYLYRVFIKNLKLKADTGFVYTGTSEYQPLPKPLDLKAEFSDRKVNLTWNHRYFKQIYNAYILERSDDGGKAFHPITSEPIVNLIPSEKADPELFYKTDSLPENGKVYYYRVKGINSFGETSEPSDVTKGAGHQAISFTPYITENFKTDNKNVTLKWEFPAEKNAEISGFKLARSSNPKTGFKYIAENINAESREYTDEKPLLTNYYVISAFNRHGEEARSMPVIIQMVDSIPPAPPVHLEGHIDTTGTVTLCWKTNTEEDIFGYRIYRSNYAREEFSQITSAPIKDTCFADKISLETLTRSVFYRVMAIDQRQNHSTFSEAIELKRPDKIAPVQPVFKTVKSTPTGVYLEWINSTSIDVKSHLLYRGMPGKNEWKLIGAFDISDSITNFTDSEADSVNYCSYTLIAKDFDGNESQPATPVNGKKIDVGIRQGISTIYVNVNREIGTIELAWKRPQGSIFRYFIYRARGNSELTLYKSIPGTSEIFTDTELKVNTNYQYSIKVVYANGNQSGFSKPTSIDF